jgi:hypothetical protein
MNAIPLPALSKCYGGIAPWTPITSISEVDRFITMAARVIPKWFRRFAALLILRGETGRSYCAMSNSVHR